jgi:hypothetical protein
MTSDGAPKQKPSKMALYLVLWGAALAIGFALTPASVRNALQVAEERAEAQKISAPSLGQPAHSMRAIPTQRSRVPSRLMMALPQRLR